MAQPKWTKTLAEVLQQNTEIRTFKSGNDKEYQAEVIPLLEVVSTGSVEELDGQFAYAIVDIEHQLEYSIKTTNRLEVSFGTQLVFNDVRGGQTNNGRGWYKAEGVRLAK